MTPNASIPLSPTLVDINAIRDYITIVLYTMTIVLGTTGNALVIWVAGFKLKPNVTNVWLVNLAVADLVFCLTRVLTLVKKLFFDHWPFGDFLCKFNGFFKYGNMFCSVFLLAVISADRALCVWRPIFTKRHRTLWAARLVSTGVWMMAAILSAPYFAYRQVQLDKNNLTKCSLEVSLTKGSLPTGGNSTKLVLSSIRFLCGFLLPFLVILCCYTKAGLGIHRTRLVGKSRPLRILASLVCAFFLCWAPYHCLLLVKMVDSRSAVVRVCLTVASGLAYFNSCVNPLMYFCIGLDVKKRFSLAGVFRRALADDAEGPLMQSNQITGSGSRPPAVANQFQVNIVND